MGTFFTELRHRRVPQILGLYLGGAWGVVQFVDWVVRRYLLSNHITDAVLLVIASLLPAAALVAWNHGAPGKDPWGRAEKIGIPLNLALTAVLLVLFLQGKSLGATAETRTVTDEEGQAVERVVPKEAFRSGVVLYFWDNTTGSPELDLWRYGVPELLALDLGQNPYVEAITPFFGFEKQFLAHLAKAGFDDGLGVPLALQRRTAQDFQLEYFVTGQLETRGATNVLEATLHGADPSTELPADGVPFKVQGDNALDLIDRLSAELRGAMNIPSGSVRLAADRAIAEHASASIEALQSYVLGRRTFALNNNREYAIYYFRKAVEEDPTFALAWSRLSETQADSGEIEAAIESALQAQRHDYKLSERAALRLKANTYWLQGDLDRSLAVYEMWVDLYPDDTRALATLASNYQWNGNRIDEAIATYERLLALDPQATWALERLGRIWLGKGDPERALDFFERYRDADPDGVAAWRRLGQLHRQAGRFELAREHFEKAQLLESGSVTATLDLVDLALREGDVGAAEELIQRAELIAANPQAEAEVIWSRLAVDELTGHFQRYVDRLTELDRVLSSFRSPMNIVGDLKVMQADRWVEAGRQDEVKALLDEVASGLEPPFDQFVDFGRVMVHLKAGDVELAEASLERIEDFFEARNREDMMHYTVAHRGKILLLRGDASGAVQTYAEALELYGRSARAIYNSEGLYPLLTDYARACRLAGDPTAAEAALQRVFESFPAYPRAHLEMAWLRVDQGRFEEAQSHLDRALDLWVDADATYSHAREARALGDRLAQGAFDAQG